MARDNIGKTLLTILLDASKALNNLSDKNTDFLPIFPFPYLILIIFPLLITQTHH